VTIAPEERVTAHQQGKPITYGKKKCTKVPYVLERETWQNNYCAQMC